MENVVDWVTSRHLSFSSKDRLTAVQDLCKRAVKHTSHGHVVEFGMALGGTGIVLAEVARDNKRAFHGFDVFEMIPEPASEKDDKRSKERYKVIKSGKAKGHVDGELYYGYRKDLLENIKDKLSERGHDVVSDDITFHKGLIQSTWPPLDDMRIAFAHVDCDWYDPVKCCLDHLKHRTERGGIIVVDDYFSFQGATLATDEFLASNTDFSWFSHKAKAIRRN